MAINLGRTPSLLFENAGSSHLFPVLVGFGFLADIFFASFGPAAVVAAFLVTALPRLD